MIPLTEVSYIRVEQGGKPHREIWGNLLPSPSTKNGTQVPLSVAQKQNTSLEFCMV